MDRYNIVVIDGASDADQNSDSFSTVRALAVKLGYPATARTAILKNGARTGMMKRGLHEIPVYGSFRNLSESMSEWRGKTVFTCPMRSFPDGMVESVGKGVSKGHATCLSGWNGVDAGHARIYDRMPGGQRFSEDDSGDIKVEWLLRTFVCLDSSDAVEVATRMSDAPDMTTSSLSAAISACGVSITCVDPGMGWERPVKSRLSNVVKRTAASRNLRDMQGWMPKAPFLEKEAHGNETKTGSESVAPLPDSSLPILPVVFLTHNRTAVACHCLDALCKRLVYDGRIHWCVSDDRSENGHVEALERVLALNGVKEYSVMRTSENKWGLGASMNNGLALSFGLSDVVLTTEDDFLLRTQFDITRMVRDVLSNNVAGIRLAHVDVGKNTSARYTTVKPSSIPGYLMVVGGSDRNIRHRFVFNNQVMLRHRRVYDSIGMYTYNVDPDTMEEDEVEKYNLKYDSGRSSAMPVLYPGMLPVGTLDNGLFVHVGRSVTGHGHHVMDPGYEILNRNEADGMARGSRDPSSVLSTVKNVVLNDLDYPGRIGNIMMLIAQTYMMAIDIGVDMDNVFFRRRVDTYNGWINSAGKRGDRLPDYLMENKDIVRPLLVKLLDDGSFYALASKNNCIKMRNEINTPVIHGFSKVVRMEKYTGLISSLFYDKEVFERHRAMFKEYYTENAVALHVRRTDFALLPAAAMTTNASAMDMQKTVDGLSGKTVVVFSDDIKWCTDNLKPPSGGKIIFHNSPGAPCDDLILMSCFKTVLQTEEISTYSLMAKLLSEDLQKTGKMFWI